MSVSLCEDTWWLTPRGRDAQEWAERVLTYFLEGTSWHYAVQLGLPRLDVLSCAKVRRRWRVSPVEGEILANFDQLPFLNESIDCIVAPFTWSLTHDPFTMLREIDRILVPEGRLFFTGFNPWSPHRLWQDWPKRLPIIAADRLSDHLKLLGFEIRGGIFGSGEDGPSGNKFCGKLSNRWLPIFRAFYLLEAIKRVTAVQIIKMRNSQNLYLQPSGLSYIGA